MIYLDNAATSGKKPKLVIDAVLNGLKYYSANPGRSGYKASTDTTMAVYRVREKIYNFFGAKGPENVCFTANCTHAINFVLNGVLDKGDHVIVSCLEHNAVMRPLHYLRERKGIVFDIAEVDFSDPNKTLDNFKKLIKPNTKMIFITHGSNVTGTIIPIEKIGTLCKEKGILFGVDAAQTAGVLNINMEKMNVDYLCVAAHKGLYAPMGAGILIANKPIENITVAGGTGSNSNEMKQPEFFPERIESGTLNVSTVLGIGAGVDFVKKMGVDNIYTKELNHTQYFYERLKKIDCKLYSPYPEKDRYLPVISFNFKDKNSLEIGEYLGKNGIAVRSGLHCAPYAHKYIGTSEIGTVRISPGLFNSKNDLDSIIYILKKYK